MLIQSLLSPIENKESNVISSAESGKVRQNPHPTRTKTDQASVKTAMKRVSTHRGTRRLRLGSGLRIRIFRSVATTKQPPQPLTSSVSKSSFAHVIKFCLLGDCRRTSTIPY